MPIGVYTRTQYHIEINRKGHLGQNKGKPLSEEHKRKIGEANKIKLKGKKHSEEWKKKMSERMKGHKVLEETRRKISEAHKGKIISEKHKRKMSEGRKGMKLSEEHKRNLSKASKGKKLSKEVREHMSRGRKGIIFSEEHKRKLSEWHISHPNKKFKDTSIELKVEAELIKRGINYQKQVPLCKTAIVDFYLPEHRIVIQADGDYWHNIAGRRENDARQDAVLTFNGFNVYRFWEKEINQNISNCIDKIKFNN
jgi:very-short-patch-repair endonuclease